jgi:D-2-hydroxyacid dehydrogenase (NADP+)
MSLDAQPRTGGTVELVSYVLLSARVAHLYGSRIDQVLAGTSYRTLTLPAESEALAADALEKITLAFFSRDLRGETIGPRASTETRTFFKVLDRSPNLRWVQVFSAGIDRPVYTDLRQRGVVITTSAGANSGMVGLTAVTALLMLSRRIPTLMAAQQRHSWEPLLGERTPQDLGSQRATIVGQGPIGQEIARLLKVFGVNLTGVRRSATPSPYCDRVVAYADLREVLPETDWLVLACPLTDITQGMIDGVALGLLPASAHLINVARGKVVVETDLIQALQKGVIAGAYLDVFAHEPLDPQSPLWDMGNVVVSPHTAAAVSNSDDLVADVFIDNLTRWLEGAPQRGVVPSLA